MSFGNSNKRVTNPVATGAAVAPTPTGPAYTPILPNAGVGGGATLFSGLKSTSPSLSSVFKTLVGGAGGLGRKPSTSKRALIGGE